jgi:hypothetical protein
MHAVVVQVVIDAARSGDATKMLIEQVVPRTQQAPGFLDGYWMSSDDQTRGLSVELFDTRDAAEAFAASARDLPAGSPATIERVEVLEVVAST